MEQKGSTESSLQLNGVFLNTFPYFLHFSPHSIFYSFNIILSKKGKEEKRKIAALLKCENPYVRYREMDGFQVAKKDMESRSKYPT